MMPSTAREADFGWKSTEFTACPYPFYEALQQEAPVYRVTGTKTFLVSRWADIAYITERPSEFLQPGLPPGSTPDLDVDYPTENIYTPYPTVTSNGQEHRTKRGWGMRMVTRPRLRSYESMITSICHELIDEFIDQGWCEFRWAFAEQLPARLMMDILGLPRKDAEMFMVDEAGTKAEYDHWNAYVQQQIEYRLREPTDDLLSELVHDQIETDGVIDIDFQVAQGVNLIRAGSETTAHLLVSMMTLLDAHPDVLARVRADHLLLPQIVEETMRLESPVQWYPRVAANDCVVGGVEIPAGAMLFLLCGAGNRDPEKYECPAEFRIDRPAISKTQLGFGRAAHLCLGAPLARLEGRLAFECLFDRMDRIWVDHSRSDFSNIMKAMPPQVEGIYDTSGMMHAPAKLAIAFEAHAS